MNQDKDRDYTSQNQERVSEDVRGDETTENTLHICCRCYWRDQCCEGCMVPQFECDDFTPLVDGVGELDYIEKEYLDDMQGRIGDYEDYIREMGGFDNYE